MGLTGGHFLLTNYQADVKQTGGYVIPAVYWREYACASSHVTAGIWFAPGSRTVGQVLALHMDAIKGVRGGAMDHAIYLV
jgi:hypothetical protein